MPNGEMWSPGNACQRAGQPLSRRLARFVLTGDPDPDFISRTIDQMAALEGRYEIAPGDVRRIVGEDGGLYSERNDGDPLQKFLIHRS